MATTNILLNNLFRDFGLQSTPVPQHIKVSPWDCSMGERIHELELSRWSAETGFKNVTLPTERKMTTAQAYATPSDVEYWDASILSSLEPGTYVLQERERTGDWEYCPNEWHYRTWIFEVVR